MSRFLSLIANNAQCLVSRLYMYGIVYSIAIHTMTAPAIREAVVIFGLLGDAVFLDSISKPPANFCSSE